MSGYRSDRCECLATGLDRCECLATGLIDVSVWLQVWKMRGLATGLIDVSVWLQV